MAQDKGDSFFAAEVREPVSQEQTLNRYSNVFPIGCYCLQKDLGACFDVSVEHNLSFLVDDAQVHTFRVQVDSTIKSVRLGVKCHRASLCRVFWVLHHTALRYN